MGHCSFCDTKSRKLHEFQATFKSPKIQLCDICHSTMFGNWAAYPKLYEEGMVRHLGMAFVSFWWEVRKKSRPYAMFIWLSAMFSLFNFLLISHLIRLHQ